MCSTQGIFTSSRAALAMIVLIAIGCEEEDSPEIQPVVVQTGGDRSALRAERDPSLVSPHLRRRDQTEEERAAFVRELELAASRNTGRGAGGGGGGRRFGNTADEWIPSPNPRPSQREIDAFRERLQREREAEVDPTADPCAQYRSVAEAGMNAARQPGEPPLEPPSASDMDRACRGLPDGYRPCMAPAYYREHLEECREVMQAMSRDGDRRMESAQEEWRAFQRGEHPSQTGGAPAPVDDDPAAVAPDDEAG